MVFFMCLVNFHFHAHANYKLIVAANRDEFYKRPTATAHFWEDHSTILAGRDLEQNGTWLGITKNGRFAALTNYRAPGYMQSGKYSRGALVSNYLLGNETPETYIKNIQPDKAHYSGFNLLLGDSDHLMYYNNINDSVSNIEFGTHSLSNHFLNTPWPKVVKGKNRLHAYVTEQETIDPEDLFTILADKELASDDRLPDTGVGLTLERQLSPLFINIEDYGTRCSTVLLISKNNYVTFIERTYHQGKYIGEENFSFKIDS